MKVPQSPSRILITFSQFESQGFHRRQTKMNTAAALSTARRMVFSSTKVRHWLRAQSESLSTADMSGPNLRGIWSCPFCGICVPGRTAQPDHREWFFRCFLSSFANYTFDDDDGGGGGASDSGLVVGFKPAFASSRVVASGPNLP